MQRVFLAYRGHSMELRDGETVVGRGLACQMRLNDPSVSRRHARISVQGARATLQDLKSRNGTRLNGEEVSGVVELHHGDVVAVGDRVLEVRIEEAEESFEESTVSRVTYVELPSDRPPASRLASAGEQRCPECKSPVSEEDDLCKSCGYSWADFRPGAVTRRVRHSDPGQGRERRRHARHRVEVPVRYSSDNLTVESMALDLSRGGIFVRTQILDEVGTRCELTVMADGAPALTLRGRVRRVVDRPDAEHPLGLGIEFLELDPMARRWLDDTIARVGSSG